MIARLLWVLILFTSIPGYSQSVHAIINSSGNSFKKDHLSLEWSIGEMSLINTMQKTVANLESMSIDNGDCVELAKLNLARVEASYKLWKSNVN